MNQYRQYPTDSRDADIRTEHERYTLFVLGLAILFFAATGIAAALAYWGIM